MPRSMFIILSLISFFSLPSLYAVKTPNEGPRKKARIDSTQAATTFIHEVAQGLPSEVLEGKNNKYN